VLCRNLPYFKRDCDVKHYKLGPAEFFVFSRNLPYFKRDCDVLSEIDVKKIPLCRNLPYFKRDCDRVDVLDVSV